VGFSGKYRFQKLHLFVTVSRKTGSRFRLGGRLGALPARDSTNDGLRGDLCGGRRALKESEGVFRGGTGSNCTIPNARNGEDRAAFGPACDQPRRHRLGQGRQNFAVLRAPRCWLPQRAAGTSGTGPAATADAGLLTARHATGYVFEWERWEAEWREQRKDQNERRRRCPLSQCPILGRSVSHLLSRPA
jgi:hypothetical protein